MLKQDCIGDLNIWFTSGTYAIVLPLFSLCFVMRVMLAATDKLTTEELLNDPR